MHRPKRQLSLRHRVSKNLTVTSTVDWLSTSLSDEDISSDSSDVGHVTDRVGGEYVEGRDFPKIDVDDYLKYYGPRPLLNFTSSQDMSDKGS